MGQSSWLVAGIVPGVERQPLKKLAVDESALQAIGAVCMIFFGAALVAIGLSVGMWGYAIAGAPTDQSHRVVADDRER
jgi:hypothetical protein